MKTLGMVSTMTTKKMELLSKKQIQVISNFGTTRYRIHVGPYGCGKSYGLSMGFGLKLRGTKPGRLGYLIVGKTAALAKSTIGDELSTLFGNDFKLTSSRKDDDKSKDAMLFGHRIYFGGMNDKESIRRILGKSYKGILCDEVTSITLEQFKLLQGRLRGEPPHWFEGSCNPQGPTHWLKLMLDADTNNRYNHTKWFMEDNICSWASDYYKGLMEEYETRPSYLARYVYGEWSAADDMVYGDTFNDKYHIIDDSELIGAQYKYYKIGVDFGMENPSVALLCGVMPGGEHVILKEWYKPQAKDINLIVQNIISMYQRTPGKVIGVYVDPSASALIKGLKNGGLWNVKKANNDVIDGIQSVNTLLSSDKLYIARSCENTINEMYTYSYSKKDGEIVEKTNDHCMDALRYLVHTN